MIVQRLYDQRLAQASYLIACGRAGEAVVIDPLRDIRPYLRAAEEQRVRITHVTETHIHADFVSGSRDLARATGARLHLSAMGGTDWAYRYAEDAGARLMRDGDGFRVGNVRVRAVHTPGHTPEHLAFLITDGAVAEEPIGVVTGDFVFVGDVGRPDLLEKAAGHAGTMDDAARTLFRSLQQFKQFPDWLQIWPGHGAGSACGKGLSSVPHSTVGYERRFNWAFQINDEDTFVRAVLEGQPEPPRYFAVMKQVNRDGPARWDPDRMPPALTDDGLRTALRSGTPVVDARPADSFAGLHVAGTVNIPLNRSFNTWAGALLPHDRDLALIAPAGQIAEALRELAMVGLDRVTAATDELAVTQWTGAGIAAGTVRSVSPVEASAQHAAGAAIVVDVRGRAEWNAGHVPGAVHIPLGELPLRLSELPAGRPLIMQCQGGGRSAIATSIAQSRGIADVANLAGGLDAWRAARLPIEADSPAGVA